MLKFEKIVLNLIIFLSGCLFMLEIQTYQYLSDSMKEAANTIEALRVTLEDYKG